MGVSARYPGKGVKPVKRFPHLVGEACFSGGVNGVKWGG